MDKLRKIIRETIEDILIYESKDNEVKDLQKKLNSLENVELEKLRKLGKGGSTEWDSVVDEMNIIREKLFQLTGDGYGETKIDKEKRKKKEGVKPNGLNSVYDYPIDVPKDVYRWILKNTSLLYTDASDAVRWSRIINSKNESRYPRGEMTIYRAADNSGYDNIRERDWVTTDEKYAIEHNKRYFNGNGKVISMNVDGRDVLVSPTGNYEEAIYAPIKHSIDVNLK